MTHERMIETAYALAVALVAVGTAIAIAAVRGITGWRWR